MTTLYDYFWAVSASRAIKFLIQSLLPHAGKPAGEHETGDDQRQERSEETDVLAESAILLRRVEEMGRRLPVASVWSAG